MILKFVTYFNAPSSIVHTANKEIRQCIVVACKRLKSTSALKSDRSRIQEVVVYERF